MRHEKEIKGEKEKEIKGKISEKIIKEKRNEKKKNMGKEERS